jgi:hypothetical protein
MVSQIHDVFSYKLPFPAFLGGEKKEEKVANAQMIN